VSHERLKLAREARGWSVTELSRRSGISPRAVALIEAGQFAELPAGLYGRASIRGYASAVGLDPDDLLESLRPLLPLPEDPLDGLARRCGHARKVEPREPSGQAPSGRVDLPPEPIRPAADATGTPATRSTPGASRRWWRPLAASTIDAVLLTVIGAVLARLTAVACGTTVAEAFRIAAPGMAVVFALIVALYFVLFGGVGNGTLGVSLMRLAAPPSGRIVLHPGDVFGRARRSMFHDSSLLAE
jgi:transcriptional regulator with XRE-family HTH domain